MPPQVLTLLGVAATNRLAGKVSVKSKPLKASAFGLVIVNVKVDAPPVGMAVGKKALLMVGLANTFNIAALLTAPAAPVCVDETPVVVLL